jgi:hypothetical protein
MLKINAFFAHGTFYNPMTGQTMPIEESEYIWRAPYIKEYPS